MFVYKCEKSRTPYSRELLEFMYKEKIFWQREFFGEKMSMEEVNKCVIVRRVNKLKDRRVSREDGTRIMKEIYDPEKYGLVEKPRPECRPFWETTLVDRVRRTRVSVSPTKTPSKLSHAKSEKKTVSNKSTVSVSSPAKPSPVSSPKVPSRSHESKKSPVSTNARAPVSTPITPISISHAPVTPAVRTTPTSIPWFPSTPVVAPGSPAVLSKSNSVLQRTPVTDSSSGDIDIIIKYQFDICLFDILFWPNFDVVSLRKTPDKVSFSPSPVAPVSNFHEAPEDGDSDSELDDFHSSPIVELFPEDQEQELNFIVEGCVFRGDIEIPTPPPSDAEQEDPPPDSDGRPWKDVRVPSPEDTRRFIPSAAFSRSREEEQRSNTPPDEFDRYLAESFRPVTVPLLPATVKTPPPQKSSQRAATTGVARAARAVPSSDTIARRLSYSDASFIHQSHGERDPNRAAVSDEDTRFDDDPDLDPDEWQDQALYDDLLCGVAATSTCSSPSGYPDSDMDAYCGGTGDPCEYGDY
jgi:hypothetical protein